MNAKLLLLISFVFCTFSMNSAFSQKRRRSDFYGKSNIDMMRTKYSRHGIIFSLGATTLLTKDELRAQILDVDPTKQYFFRSGGNFRFMAEIGMLHFTKTRKRNFLIIDHYDWAIGIKTFRGWEETRLYETGGLESDGTTGRGELSLGYISGRFGVHNMIKLNKRMAIDHGPGINLDYRIFGNAPGDNGGYQLDVLPSTQRFETNFMAQVHYELGIRIRVYNMWHITPMVQMPVFGIQNWDGGRPSINWFSTRYQPLIFKLKIYHPLKSRGKSTCPAVYGSPEDERRNQEYMEGK
jgi:hypothetical protein